MSGSGRCLLDAVPPLQKVIARLPKQQNTQASNSWLSNLWTDTSCRPFQMSFSLWSGPLIPPRCCGVKSLFSFCLAFMTVKKTSQSILDPKKTNTFKIECSSPFSTLSEYLKRRFSLQKTQPFEFKSAVWKDQKDFDAYKGHFCRYDMKIFYYDCYFCL